MKKMFREGDFIEIPLHDGRVAIGWIIYVSKHFKDTVGFIVFGVKGETRDVQNAINVLGPYYTHIANIHDFGCKVVDYVPVPESKRALTKRKVGGGVYVADEYIGSIDDFDTTELGPMLFKGMALIVSEVESAFRSV